MRAQQRGRLIAGLAILASMLTPARAEFIIENFTDVSRTTPLPDGSIVGRFPPDTMGAVGPSDLVAVTNGSYSYYDKRTGTLAAPHPSTDFWVNAGITNLGPAFGTITVDPRILFDRFSLRFYTVALDSDGTIPGTQQLVPNRLLVAVSNSSDPTKGWTGFAIPNRSGGFERLPDAWHRPECGCTFPPIPPVELGAIVSSLCRRLTFWRRRRRSPTRH